MSITGLDLIKVLRRHGWVLDRVKGSHHTMVKEGFSAIVTVPCRSGKELKRGTLHSILKTAKLKESDLS